MNDASSSTSLHQAKDEHDSALLIIDMISNWQFPDADKLLPPALAIVPCIARLKARCKQAGVPVVYANDNGGRWRSDWRELMEHALAAGGAGAHIARQLHPDKDDYFVLKPLHSAFFGTPLQLLLQHLGTRRLLLAGVASDQCVMTTAAAAKMHGYDVRVPRDAIATQTAERARAALKHFDDVLRLDTSPAAELSLD